jgi:redox-sensitive bicupin YhaK (pirin superfamily)
LPPAVPEATVAGVATLLERKSELAATRSALRRGGAVVVEGHAGIGKTAIDVSGMEMRDAGYLHARSGTAQALLALGEPRRARELAEA